MRRHRIILLLLLILAGLASCSSGHLGGNEIAFLRDGHLWTIDPDGTNAFEVVSDSPAVIGYGWSPNHQIFVFRTLDSNYATTSAARYLVGDPISGLIGDLPGTLNTVGIDGGSPIPITLSSSNLQRSNAWWNPTGNRLLYREETAASRQNPGTVSWWISQNDQPEQIARKFLPYTFSIPSLSENKSQAIGNSEQGVFTTTLAGTSFQFVIQGNLQGHPLPATLERVLWQPAHQNPAFLYAIVTNPTQPQPSATTPPAVQLILRDTHGLNTPIATCACTQFAWSPDGNSVLYSTGTMYTVLNVNNHSSFRISGEDSSIPYWSPDSQFLLLDGLHTLQLVQVSNQRQQLLLKDSEPTAAPGTASSAMPGIHALLQPLSNSPWASDSRHFLFLSRGRVIWQGQHLSTGNGLYTASIDERGQVQRSPTIIDNGNDSQAGWTYEDPNTSFLF
jgi:hypothetical protein